MGSAELHDWNAAEGSLTWARDWLTIVGEIHAIPVNQWSCFSVGQFVVNDAEAWKRLQIAPSYWSIDGAVSTAALAG